MANIYSAVDWAIAVAEDDTHGYSQSNRNGPDYDCSSFVSTALMKGGFKISPYSWTGNMVYQLKADGFYEVPIDSERQLGDIFINEQHHVIMCIDAYRVVYASINEFGGVTGGKPGDQTGREILIGNYYKPSYGWDYHLRPPKSSYEQEQEKPKEKRTLMIRW